MRLQKKPERPLNKNAGKKEKASQSRGAAQEHERRAKEGITDEEAAERIRIRKELQSEKVKWKPQPEEEGNDATFTSECGRFRGHIHRNKDRSAGGTWAPGYPYLVGSMDPYRAELVDNVTQQGAPPASAGPPQQATPQQETIPSRDMFGGAPTSTNPPQQATPQQEARFSRDMFGGAPTSTNPPQQATPQQGAPSATYRPPRQRAATSAGSTQQATPQQEARFSRDMFGGAPTSTNPPQQATPPPASTGSKKAPPPKSGGKKPGPKPDPKKRL